MGRGRCLRTESQHPRGWGFSQGRGPPADPARFSMAGPGPRASCFSAPVFCLQILGGEGFPNLPTKVMLVGPGGEAEENRLGGRQGFHVRELSWAVKTPLPGTSSPPTPPAPWKLLWFWELMENDVGS